MNWSVLKTLCRLAAKTKNVAKLLRKVLAKVGSCISVLIRYAKEFPELDVKKRFHWISSRSYV